MPLAVSEPIPILYVLRKVDLLRGAEQASYFWYISQICGYMRGNIPQRRGFSLRSGSSVSRSLYSFEIRLDITKSF